MRHGIISVSTLWCGAAERAVPTLEAPQENLDGLGESAETCGLVPTRDNAPAVRG